MELNVNVKYEPVVVKLERGGEKVIEAISLRSKIIAEQLVNRVKDKLSNQLLHVRTGHLRTSIKQRVEASDASVTATVYSDGIADPYAAVHEYGLEVRKRVSKNPLYKSKAVGGPTFQMPERSYMRSTGQEMRQMVIDSINKAAVDALK